MVVEEEKQNTTERGNQYNYKSTHFNEAPWSNTHTY